MNVFEKYEKMGKARSFFNEYQQMARLVDDLDTRFWKRFVTRDSRRVLSIDEALSEKTLRREYQGCVSDMLVLREKVNAALASVKSDICRDLMTEYFIHDLDYEEIAVKWRMDEADVCSLIQKGLLEAEIPEGSAHGIV